MKLLFLCLTRFSSRRRGSGEEIKAFQLHPKGETYWEGFVARGQQTRGGKSLC